MTASSRAEPQAAQSSSPLPHCGLLERLPKWLICIPLALQWLGLALRYRSFTLPSAVNSAITAGGLIGEGKLEYFRGMQPSAQSMIARHGAIRVDQTCSRAALLQCISEAGLAFPLIVKPDLGLCGYGVRLISNIDALLVYTQAFPRNEVLVLQEYLPQEGEAGIFYARDPLSDRASLIGLALRYFPRVIGDGHSTVAQLIDKDPRARRARGSSSHQPTHALHEVPAAGQIIRLATIGSTRVGGLYRDGGALITPALTEAIDSIARAMPDFYSGRFDVRFDDTNALREGRGFTVIEINGAGSEAIQAWDPDIPIWQAFRIIFAKQRLLFAIGAARRRQGVRTIGVYALACLNRRQQRLIAQYPPSN